MVVRKEATNSYRTCLIFFTKKQFADEEKGDTVIEPEQVIDKFHQDIVFIDQTAQTINDPKRLLISMQHQAK